MQKRHNNNYGQIEHRGKETDAQFAKRMLAEGFVEYINDCFEQLVQDSDAQNVTEKQMAARVKSFKHNAENIRKRAKSSLDGAKITFMWEI